MSKAKEKKAEGVADLRKRVRELEREISGYRKADRARRESEEKFRSLVESTDDSIYVLDRGYRYLFMNKKHLSRLGISGTQYLGKRYSDFHSPDETDAFVEKFDEVLLRGRSIQYQHRSRRTGEYFLRTLSPIRGDDGEIRAVTIVSKDINELKRAEFERDRIIFELQDALAHIKTLKGLIPICAWCKKIRDDSGYWQQLETYIKEHSDADFTHGICEECMQKLRDEEEGE